MYNIDVNGDIFYDSSNIPPSTDGFSVSSGDSVSSESVSSSDFSTPVFFSDDIALFAQSSDFYYLSSDALNYFTSLLDNYWIAPDYICYASSSSDFYLIIGKESTYDSSFVSFIGDTSIYHFYSVYTSGRTERRMDLSSSSNNSVSYVGRAVYTNIVPEYPILVPRFSPSLFYIFFLVSLLAVLFFIRHFRGRYM